MRMVEVVSWMLLRHPPLEASTGYEIGVFGAIVLLVHIVQYKMGAAIMTVVLELGSLWREIVGGRHYQSRADSGLTRASG